MLKYDFKLDFVKICAIIGAVFLHGLVLTYFDVFKRIGLDNMTFWQRPVLAVFGLTFLAVVISGILTFVLGLIPGWRMLIGNDGGWPFLLKKKKINFKA